MGKKDKKKGKPQPGDWSDDESKAPAAAPAQNGAGSDEEDEPQQKSAASRFNFSSFVDDGAGDDDEDDDGGGLMAAIRSSESRKKSKKDKKKAKTASLDDDEAGEGGEAAAEDAVDLASKAPTEMTADQLMDEEFGPSKSKAKGKKGKKGKNQQQPGIDDDDFLDQQIKNLSVQNANSAAKSEPEPAKPQADAPQAVADEKEDAADDGEPRLLSKKEKERLKKEKEKAKKKAQAAAKKATGAGQAPEATDDVAASPTVETSQATAADEDADDAEEGEGAGDPAASKNKKKKKKGAAAKQEDAAAAAAAKPAAGRKVPAHIAALQAAMAKQKAAEEEARKREEEERKRIEDEEARQAELERQKEEEKKRKKEKEKAKKEQLKKEGKYLTPKQKADAAAAAARREAMIASGQIKVDGLTSPTEAETTVPKTKKPTYGKKKAQAKKAGSGGLEVPAIISATPTEPEETIQEDPTREAEHEPEAAQAATADSTVPIAGDNSKAMADAEAEDDLDDWDAESASEKEEDKKPAPVAKSNRAVDQKSPSAQTATASKDKVQENGSAKPSTASKPTPSKPALSSTAPAKQTDKATNAPVKAPVQAKESEDSASEEDEEEDEDEDDEDEDEDDEDEESSDEDEDSDSDSDSEDSEEERISTAKKAAAQRKAEAAARREQKRKDAIAAGSKDDLRSPICCILGHVDTGKTKLLDKIRQSNVQEGEAGGITQQIGATYFPTEAIQSKTAVLGDADIKEYKLPGLLVIDTPGHESFTNLRTRGSSLCNIAILVVDIMHGLEPQTLESIRLLRTGKTPFIVALNKIDRLYGWQATPNGAFRESLAKQSRSVQAEFQKRLTEALLAFSEQGLNAVPYYENTNFAKYVSVVPTSAHTGEGIADMLMLITKLTQERMSGQLMYITELECTVLEVKVIEGLGTTLDVVLVNGVLNEGDKIVVCGLNGPIVTQVRALLTPQPMKELRIRGQYVHHQQIKAAMGIKIVAPELEKAIAGSRLLVCGEDDDEDELREAVMADLQSLASSVDKSGRGVYVQASTLGSLEALLEFLKQSKIPVSNINIGPVHKKDVTRCAAMLDRSPELAVILAFDVPVDKEAERLAEENNIKIFKADIIYHLFDEFTKHNQAILEAKRKDAAPTAVWPCRLKVLKCFAKRDPIILGCDIIEGSSLRVGTPLCVVKVDPETKQKTIVKLGKVTSLEINHKAMEVVKKTQVGAGVAVKIEHAVYESAKLFGRHFNEHDELISLVSRASIDALKTHFREQVDKDDWAFIAKKLKPLLDVA